jgi:hypothetical protein
MTYYVLILELIFYVSVIYLFLRKRDLVVLYVPLFFFLRNLISWNSVLPGMVQIGLILFCVVYSFMHLRVLRTFNVFAIILWVYFSMLFAWGGFGRGFDAFWIFSCIVIVLVLGPTLYQRHGRKVIEQELFRMACCVIGLFLFNSILSTAVGYSPNPLYGRTSGILYGVLSNTHFMVVPLVLFLFLAYNPKKTSLVTLGVGFLTFAFLLLTFRRSAAFAAVLAVVGFLLLVFLQREARTVVLVGAATLALVVPALLFSGLSAQFEERYEARFGGGPPVKSDSSRFSDHVMVYEDMFVHGRYGVLTGFGFFQSAGNYGGGIYETRSLHADIPAIAHASGIIGVALYFLAVGTAFWQSFVCGRGVADRVHWWFCLLVFIVFTISGRITEPAYAVGFFLVLLLPTASGRRRRAGQVAGSITSGTRSPHRARERQEAPTV